MILLFRKVERFVWLAFVTGIFSIAGYMVVDYFEDAAANPIMTTIDTIDVTQVPFPAVTVLPAKHTNHKYVLVLLQ